MGQEVNFVITVFYDDVNVIGRCRRVWRGDGSEETGRAYVALLCCQFTLPQDRHLLTCQATCLVTSAGDFLDFSGNLSIISSLHTEGELCSNYLLPIAFVFYSNFV